MSVCHQAHNIPWSILQQNLHIQSPYNSTNQTCTNFYPRSRPNESKELKHFAKKFAATIRDFSRAQRGKEDAQVQLKDLDGKVIPDDMLGLEIDHACPILPDEQKLDWWRSQAVHFANSGNSYHPGILRELIFRNHLRHLLLLAQQLGADLLKLRCINALRLYIVINVYLMFDLYGSSPNPAHPRPASLYYSNEEYFDGAWPFALTRARNTADGDLDCSNAVTNIYRTFFADGNDYLQDTARIKGFLKRLFGVICVCEMYIRECGGEIEWEREVETVLREDLNFSIAVLVTV